MDAIGARREAVDNDGEAERRTWVSGSKTPLEDDDRDGGIDRGHTRLGRMVEGNDGCGRMRAGGNRMVANERSG